MEQAIADRLSSFGLDEFLHEHVVQVVLALPEAVRTGLIADELFCICDYEPGPQAVVHVPMGMPNGRASRSVVLKRTLRRRPAEFVRYVIAHELAHAHLHNRGRFPGDDPEHAADALAADWGFPRPARSMGFPFTSAGS